MYLPLLELVIGLHLLLLKLNILLLAAAVIILLSLVDLAALVAVVVVPKVIHTLLRLTEEMVPLTKDMLVDKVDAGLGLSIMVQVAAAAPLLLVETGEASMEVKEVLAFNLL